MGLDQGWRLARAWYSRRLEPDWRRPGGAEVQALFDRLGLKGPFWQVDNH